MMYLQMFDVSIPDDVVLVVDSHEAPGGGKAVACLVTVPMGETPFLQSLARTADERFAAVLDAMLRAGLRLVCVEAMEGSAGDPLAMGAGVAKVLRDRGAVLVGVDDLAAAQEMRQVQQFAATHLAVHTKLFDASGDYLAAAIRSLDASPVTELVSLRMRHDADQANLYDVARVLLELGDRQGIAMPLDLRRHCTAIAAADGIDVAAATREQKELLARIRLCANQEVLSRTMVTTFAVRIPGKTRGARFSHAERAAIGHCQTLVNDISVGFSGSLDEVMMYQATHRYDEFENLFDTAQLLGIDVSPYAAFRRYVGLLRLLPGGTGSLMRLIPTVMAAAWSHFQSRVPRSAAERSLVDAVAGHTTLRKVARLEATPPEYGLIAAADLSLTGVLAAIEAATNVSAGEALMKDARAFDERRGRLMRFYDLARRRARGMVTRTLQAMTAHGADRAALIFLGFHQPVVTSSLTAEGASWTVVFPAYEPGRGA